MWVSLTWYTLQLLSSVLVVAFNVHFFGSFRLKECPTDINKVQLHSTFFDSRVDSYVLNDECTEEHFVPPQWWSGGEGIKTLVYLDFFCHQPALVLVVDIVSLFMSSELDRSRTARLVEVLADLKAQVFASTTAPEHIEGLPLDDTLAVRVTSGTLNAEMP